MSERGRGFYELDLLAEHEGAPLRNIVGDRVRVQLDGLTAIDLSFDAAEPLGVRVHVHSSGEFSYIAMRPSSSNDVTLVAISHYSLQPPTIHPESAIRELEVAASNAEHNKHDNARLQRLINAVRGIAIRLSESASNTKGQEQ